MVFADWHGSDGFRPAGGPANNFASAARWHCMSRRDWRRYSFFSNLLLAPQVAAVVIAFLIGVRGTVVADRHAGFNRFQFTQSELARGCAVQQRRQRADCSQSTIPSHRHGQSPRSTPRTRSGCSHIDKCLLNELSARQREAAVGTRQVWQVVAVAAG